jgi:hypothetical protein
MRTSAVPISLRAFVCKILQGRYRSSPIPEESLGALGEPRQVRCYVFHGFRGARHRASRLSIDAESSVTEQPYGR